MAHTWDAIISVKDTGGITSKSVLRNIPNASAPDMTKLTTLVTTLKSHLNGGIMEYALLDWNKTAFASPTVTAPTGLNSTKALISFEYVDGNETLLFDKCYLPNPDVATHFEFVAGEGYRMLPASMTSLGTALSTATGLTITVTEGKLITQTGHHALRESSVMFRDEVGSLCPFAVPLATSDTALATFAGALDTAGYSKSTVVESAFLTKTVTRPVQTSGIGLAAAEAVATLPEFTCVETRANLQFNYTVGSANHSMHLNLPSVKSASCAQTKKKKNAWKFAYANGVTVATALTTFFGAGNKTVAYRTSKVKIKNLQEV